MKPVRVAAHRTFQQPFCGQTAATLAATKRAAHRHTKRRKARREGSPPRKRWVSVNKKGEPQQGDTGRMQPAGAAPTASDAAVAERRIPPLANRSVDIAIVAIAEKGFNTEERRYRRYRDLNLPLRFLRSSVLRLFLRLPWACESVSNAAWFTPRPLELLSRLSRILSRI